MTSTIATSSNCLTRRPSGGWEFAIFFTSRVARAIELDDLNSEFVALADSGIDIRLLALDDFQRGDGEQVCGGQDNQPFLFGGNEETDEQFWIWYAPLAIAGEPPNPPPWLWPRAHYRPTHRPTFLGGPAPTAGGGGPGHGHGWPHPGWGGGRSGSLGRSHSSASS